MSKKNLDPDLSQISNAKMRDKFAIDINLDPYKIPIEELDPGHPSLFEHNRFYPYFERLQKEDPVHYCDSKMWGPYWSVTKFSDIRYVDSNHELFSSDINNGGIRMGGRPVQKGQEQGMFHLPMFIMQDPPVHDDQRGVVSPAFTPSKVQELKKLIQEKASKILDSLPIDQEFNWVQEVSVELTGQILATLFGIPQGDRHKLIHWSDTVENIGNPDVFETPEQGFQELWQCFEYFDSVWKERKTSTKSGTDLISTLARGESTRNMPPNEFLGNMLLLIVGGNDTTRNSISGGVLALNEHPEEFKKLLRDPTLVTKMVPEIIRWQTPVAHMCRTAMQDVKLGEKK